MLVYNTKVNHTYKIRCDSLTPILMDFEFETFVLYIHTTPLNHFKGTIKEIDY